MSYTRRSFLKDEKIMITRMMILIMTMIILMIIHPPLNILMTKVLKVRMAMLLCLMVQEGDDGHNSSGMTLMMLMQEVEVEEKSIITEKLDAFKNKIKKKKAAIRSKVCTQAISSCNASTVARAREKVTSSTYLYPYVIMLPCTKMLNIFKNKIKN